MVVTREFIEKTYPLHYHVWFDKKSELEALLSSDQFPLADHLEKLDPRGRTPLFLAVVLGRTEIALSLLKINANALFEHADGWTTVQEAVCGGDPELLKNILEYRDGQKQNQRGDLIPNLLRQLKDAPDFYAEIKFTFTSWVPFVTRIIPGNVHKVYKMGSNVRVDSSILGGEEVQWDQGSTLIFQGQNDSVRMMEIDHATKQVFSSVILSGSNKQAVVPDSRVYENTVSHRLSNPAMISYVNLEKIAFERNKTGIWGWGSDKSEKVNTYDCKVFNATNVELVTKMRYEHLNESDKSRSEEKSNLQKMLKTFGSTETSEESPQPTSSQAASSSPKKEITAEQYFDTSCDIGPGSHDIGRTKELRTKINKFKANVWLCENYPLNLQEQVMPIVDIMAISSSHFQKLKDFIQMQIPAGFPIKIEIPMFHLVNASISFHNIFATEGDVVGVTNLQEDCGRLSCILDEDLFEPPSSYYMRSSVRPGPMNSSDDDLFGWTMPDEDSAEAGGNTKMVDIYEALNAPRTLLKDVTPDSDTEEQLLQRAIEESLMMAKMQENPDWRPSTQHVSSSRTTPSSRLESEGAAGAGAVGRSTSEEELLAVLDLSRKQVEEEEQLRREEDEALRKVLELSLQEK